MDKSRQAFDFIVIGGGFYGCCLALFLRSLSENVLLIEKEDQMMGRASKYNQARVHTGFHYPRSFTTAIKSLILHKKFIKNFKSAIFDEFKMIYAISKERSKISSKRFWKMFNEIGAPIKKASLNTKKLFNSNYIEDVFECYEAAFNNEILKELLVKRIEKSNIDVLLETEVKSIKKGLLPNVLCSNGSSFSGEYIFNVTYSGANQLLSASDLSLPKLKTEIAEIALVDVPSELDGKAITVMDGPFFSLMPFPSMNKYSLSHVRYTPHFEWPDLGQNGLINVEDFSVDDSKFIFMKKDINKYIPLLSELNYHSSFFEYKTTLVKNEEDDGRPILFYKDKRNEKIITVVGGKLDNIYDLFDFIRLQGKRFEDASDAYLFD